QILEPRAGDEDGRAQPPDDVLRGLGPPDAGERQVPADIPGDRALAAQHLEARCIFEPEMIEVGADTHLRRQVEIAAGADEDRARIVEVRLAFFLRGAQRVQYAVAAVDRNHAPAACKG